MKQIGLFFGSYNPIHVGHLIIANHIVENTELEEVWLVITPHNPHKQKANLLNQYHRLEMVVRATESHFKLRACDEEFKLPQPNYTVMTLTHLTEKHPNNNFSLLMGMDNFASLPKWKNYQAILDYHKIYVYPRYHNKSSIPLSHPNIIHTNAPMMQISSSHIRHQIALGHHITPLLPYRVGEYIDEMNFYKTNNFTSEKS